MFSRINAAILSAAIAMTMAAGPAPAQSSDVNVYTYRETKLIQPLFDAFSKDTGIKVNVISASSGLEQRIKTEGEHSPADVLLTVDIGRLEDAVRAGITKFILPKENLDALEDLPDEVRASIEVQPVEGLGDALALALRGASFREGRLTFVDERGAGRDYAPH